MRGSRLLAALVVPALALGACGDGTTDADAITKIVRDGARDPATICDHLSDALTRRMRGVDACRRQARRAARGHGGPDRITIDRLQITGDTATVRLTGRDGRGAVALVKDHGSWKIDDTTGDAR